MKNTIVKALVENKFNYRVIIEDKDRVVYNFSIELDKGIADTFIELQFDNKYILIYTVCPITVPNDQLRKISEFITRINNGIYIGNFQLNMENGRIQYKASYIFDEVHQDSENIFIQNLYTTFRMMDRYFPGIISVIYAKVSPVDAINDIENVVNPALN